MNYSDIEIKTYTGDIITPDRLKVPFGELYPFYFEDCGFKLVYICGIPIGERGKTIREIQAKIKMQDAKDLDAIGELCKQILIEVLQINYAQATVQNIMGNALITLNDFLTISSYLNGNPFPFVVKPQMSGKL